MIRLKSLAAFAAVLGMSAGASAAPMGELVPLGQSGASGAVCDAVRDYQDPVGQGGAKAWRLRCRGYSTALGRIYQVPVAQKGAWAAALASRAQCSAPGAAPGGLSATLATCKLAAGASPYVVFVSEKGGTVTVAEGLAVLADVVETGLKVALGARPPAATAVQTSAAQAEIAADFPKLGGLAAAEAAAAADPERLRGRGYVQNNEWRFDEAETAFRALVTEGEVRNAPASQRADALLNLAMNVSNNGRFEEAEGFFAEAEALIAPDDVLTRARSLNYIALHERNRGRFERAIVAARRAMQMRAAMPQAQAQASARSATGGPLTIDAGLARRLNTPSAAQSRIATTSVTVGEQLAIQDAQAWQVIGSSQAALGETALARASLEQARAILARSAALGRLTAWLQARVEADLAGLDLKDGRAPQAAARYQTALGILRTRHAGSSAEGAMLLDLGRAQAAAGHDPQALIAYQRAMGIFRAQRGGLGGSADQAAPYFDLLLRMSERNPGKAEAYGALFFDAAETVVSSATAETVNKLAARVAAGDGAIAGLSRAFEDSRRRLRATESQIAALQADGLYTDVVRLELEAILKGEQEEADALEARMAAANPRYNQLVAPGAPAGDIQKALKGGEAYVRLLPLAGRTYGVLLTRTKVKPYAVALNRYELREQVTRLRLALEPSESLLPFDAQGSAALFGKLFGPVKGDVLAAKHLIYEPDGPLVSLPVSLFVTDAGSIRGAGDDTDYVRVAWLGKSVSTSLVVSGASFLQSRAFAPSRAQQPYLGFADPALPRSEARAFAPLTRSFSRRSVVLERVCGETRNALLRIEALPETAAEVRTIGQTLGTPGSIVTGADFSDEAVRARRDLADYRVLYFATHGLLPQPDACVPEPALVTSLGGGDDSDALLDTSEILNLKIDADLVVLAACDTGGAGATVDRTGLTGGGEALGGLTRAMIYAGSRALVVSHWSIDSEAAVRLMTGLFASGAPSMADGLQKSQAALQADPKYAHPYFWAPFTLVGDGARPMPGVGHRAADQIAVSRQPPSEPRQAL